MCDCAGASSAVTLQAAKFGGLIQRQTRNQELEKLWVLFAKMWRGSIKLRTCSVLFHQLSGGSSCVTALSRMQKEGFRPGENLSTLWHCKSWIEARSGEEAGLRCEGCIGSYWWGYWNSFGGFFADWRSQIVFVRFPKNGFQCRLRNSCGSRVSGNFGVRKIFCQSNHDHRGRNRYLLSDSLSTSSHENASTTSPVPQSGRNQRRSSDRTACDRANLATEARQHKKSGREAYETAA